MGGKNLVEIVDDKLLVGTNLIAQGFLRDHDKVKNLIKKYIIYFIKADSFRKYGGKELPVRVIKTKGRPMEEFLLNKEQTLFLGTLFRSDIGKPESTKKILDFKARLASDFIKQEEIIKNIASQRQSKEWIEDRSKGIIVRKEETDTIKDFIIYAELQGSKNANKYYMTLSKCVNDQLFDFTGKFKNKRDMMTTDQLLDVKFADKIVSRGLIDGMSQGLHYKDIYQLVKTRLVSLASMYGKSDVMDKQLTI